MKELGVGLIGLGTVGCGTARVLLENARLIEKRVGCRVALRRVVDLDIETPRDVVLPREIMSTDVNDIFDDPGIQVVVELIGGKEPARSFILRAMEKGKSVVTANKALLAESWEDLFAAAERNSVELLFEGAVGGGIPIIRSLREGLAGNRIEAISGILNGTTNYILSRMTEEGIDFESALAEAQHEGYAEADPTLDVGGGDAAHKICILATLAFGARVPLQAVHTEGITGITPVDIEYASELGYRIKLLALAKESDGRVEVRVHPTMVPEGELLAGVNGAFNAVFVRGDAVGSTLFYGLGAGSMPTGSAVAGDVMSIASRSVDGAMRPPSWAVPYEPMEEGRLKPMDEVITAYYLRFPALDRPGVLSSVSGILGGHGISIASVIQKGRHEAGPVDIVMMTHEARERDMRAALGEIGELEVIAGAPTLIRVEETG